MRQLHASSERLTGAGQSFALSGLRRWAGSSGGIRRSAGIVAHRCDELLTIFSRALADRASSCPQLFDTPISASAPRRAS